MRLHRRLLAALVFPLLFVPAPHACAAQAARRGRIFVLMVWDGLRPDLVNRNDTPNLFALEHEGVMFADHHAVFPSVTMVNAAAIATGYPPGATGIFSDNFYQPSLRTLIGLRLPPDVNHPHNRAVNLEKTPNLITLEEPDLLNGKLLQAVALGQRIRLARGYVAVAGKSGPTFLFDSNEFAADAQGRRSRAGSILMVDDLAPPPALLKRIGLPPPKDIAGVAFKARDAWYTDALIDELPAAAAASNRGHPALLVLWERNPDATQHRAGLGTEESLEALTRNDENLGRLRAAIAAQRIADRTDLMVVSDHGFATQGDSLRVGEMLVRAGLKHSDASDDVILVGDQGSDLIYLSQAAFPTLASRKARLQQIVDFFSAQDWAGPIFSADPEPASAALAPDGWIAGTFGYHLLGLGDPGRAPDLIVSMREHADQSNLTFTGPERPAFKLTGSGRESDGNHSHALMRPVAGILDADGSGTSTTGMGVHGAAGRRELHNFCAAFGPDFRRHYVDADPTGNTDLAPTIARVLRLRPLHNARPWAGEGRVMYEALLQGGSRHARPVALTIGERRDLAPYSIETRLLFTRFDGRRYLDDSSVQSEPLRLTKSTGAPSAPLP